MDKALRRGAAVSAGCAAGAVLGAVFWLTEWIHHGQAHFAWALEPGFRAIFWGVTAYGATLYLLSGTLAGGLVGTLAGTLGRRLPPRAAGFLITAALAAAVFVPLFLFVNRHFLPEFRSAASLAGNAALGLGFLVVCLALWYLTHRELGRTRGRSPALGVLAGLWGLVILLDAGAAAAWHLGKPDPGPSPAGSARPNVVLFLIETTRADHLGCYGYHRDTTPNIDRIAAEGVLFEQYHVNAPFSGPSKATLHTGLYPHHSGVRSMPQRIRSDATTLAQVFRAHDYRTAGFASGVFMGPEFDYHKGYRTYECLGTPYDRFRFATALRGLGLRLHRFTPWYLDADERARVVDATRGVDRLLDWVDRSEDAPFFTLFELNEPHMLYEPPPPYDARFTEPHPGYTLMDDLREGRADRFEVGYAFEESGYDRRDLEHTVGLYDGEIAYIDDAIGRVRRGLEERGLLDDTILVVTSDHGECFGEHGVYFKHVHLYQPAVHVPMVLRYPPRLAPARVADPVQEVDLFPTLVDLAGLDYEGRGDGVSLLERLDPAGPPPPVFAEDNIMLDPKLLRFPDYRVYVPGVAGKWRMVRDGPWKLIYIPRPEGPEYELYHLGRDPEERDNAFAREPETAARLQELLRAWLDDDVRGQADVDPEAIDSMRDQLRSLGYIQ